MVPSIDSGFLKQLSLAFGPSGCEDNVAELIKEKISGLCDEITADKLGNITAFKKGSDSAEKLMIAAHMDEVGFMVTHIDDEGYLHFSLLGGIDPRVLCGRRVVVGNEKKRVHGVIMAKAIHLQNENERKETTPVTAMYIDIGAENKEKAEKTAPIGSFGTFDSEYVNFGKDGHMLKAKALDDRLGCALMCDVLEKLKEEGKTLPFDVYFAFTVREEIGYSGAQTAAFYINPDKAIILEATAIADIPPLNATVPTEHLRVAETGQGGVISYMDKSTIYDEDFVKFAFETGAKYGVKCQPKRYVSGGNDAGVIQRTNKGAKTLALSAPCRYLHTESNVIDMSDYNAMLDLLYHMIT
jgi:endoglucanase